MKHFLSLSTASALAFSLLTFASPVSAELKTVAIDTQQSSVEWLGKKLLGQHNGTVKLKSGTVELQNGVPSKGSFEIDMASISVADISDPKDNAKLAGHLKSDDFFGVQLFPTTKVELTKFEPIAGAVSGQPNYNVSGTLSIKGASHPISFPAHIEVANGKATAKAQVTVDRTLFNIRYGSNKFFDNLGDRVIKDNFEVSMNIVGNLS